MMDIRFMERALTLAAEAAQADEIPVGAVVVKDGEIIAEGVNRKERDNCAVSHAEIIAIQNACKVVNNWWLEDCEMYVTLEPCAMCATAMLHSRIKKLYFGAYDEKTGAAGSRLDIFQPGLYNHTVEVQGGILSDECGAILTEFFKNKRKNK